MTAGTSKDAIAPVYSTVTSLLCFSIPSSCAPPGGYPTVSSYNLLLAGVTISYPFHGILVIMVTQNCPSYCSTTRHLHWCRRSVVEDTESLVASLTAHGSSGYRVRLGSQDVTVCSSKCRIGRHHRFLILGDHLKKLHL